MRHMYVFYVVNTLEIKQFSRVNQTENNHKTIFIFYISPGSVYRTIFAHRLSYACHPLIILHVYITRVNVCKDEKVFVQDNFDLLEQFIGHVGGDENRHGFKFLINVHHEFQRPLLGRRRVYSEYETILYNQYQS